MTAPVMWSCYISVCLCVWVLIINGFLYMYDGWWIFCTSFRHNLLFICLVTSVLMILTASRSNTIGGMCLPVSTSCRTCCICSSPVLWTCFRVVVVFCYRLVKSPSLRDHLDTNNVPRLCRSGSRSFLGLAWSWTMCRVCYLGRHSSTWAHMR